MPILLEDLPIEEREYITQVGEISRPFAHNPTNFNIISRFAAQIQSLSNIVWEVNGVDTSVWQGDIDFSALKEKAKFIIIRYGIGNTSIDSKAVQTTVAATNAGMPYSGYWYLKPGYNPLAHADSFANVIQDLGGNLYHMSDFEESGGLGKPALNAWLQSYFNRLYTILTNRGVINDPKQHMWYSSKYIVDNLLPKPNGWMRDSSLDIASWTTANQPSIPYEWEGCNKIWKFWQHAVIYSPGYGVESAKIDLQRYNGTLTQFNTEFNLNLEIPPSQTRYVIPTGNVNTRTSPIVNSTNIIGVATPQDRFEYIGEDGEWTQAKVYLKSSYLRKE